MSEANESIVISLNNFFRLQNAFLDNFLNSNSETLLKKRFFEANGQHGSSFAILSGIRRCL